MGGFLQALAGAQNVHAIEGAENSELGSIDQAQNYATNAWNTQQQNLQPYQWAGNGALAWLNGEMPQLTQGFDPTQAGLPSQAPGFNAPAPFSYTASDFTQDPGYQFALQQGQQAIQNQAAATGQSLSPATEKALASYTTGMADQDYGNAYNRAQGTYQQNYQDALSSYGANQANFQQNYSDAFNTFNSNENNAYNRLMGMSQMGQSASNTLNQEAGAYGNQMGQYAMDSGNDAAAATLAIQKQKGGLLTDLGNSIGSLFGL
jgi:hypothetical protein